MPAIMNLAEVASVVDNEGLSYAILNYMGSDYIEDERLAELWHQADVILTEINEILSPYSE